VTAKAEKKRQGVQKRSELDVESMLFSFLAEGQTKGKKKGRVCRAARQSASGHEKDFCRARTTKPHY